MMETSGMVKIIDIIKTEDIIRIAPDENLAQALSKLTTSHDAAFVFSHDNKFLGVVNPYYSLISSSFPGNAKVEHCLFHPPKIYTKYPLPKVIELLIQSRIHYLPVISDNEGFLGIISARRILASYRDSPLFQVQIRSFLKFKTNHKYNYLVTVQEDDPITHAIALFKSTKVSKLVVVAKDKKLKGILSYYDIISFLISPRESHHQDRYTQKSTLHHMKVKHFAKTYVLTLSPDDFVIKALHLILDKKIGSVVIVDKARYPIGIITTRDLLRFLVRGEREKQVEIISRNLSDKSRQIVGGFFNYFRNWVGRKPDVAKAKIFVKEEKQGGLFKIVLSLIPKKGSPQIIEREGKNLSKMLKKIKKD